AISDGGLSRLLSTRAAVFGGHISYSVYLVHMLLIEPLWWSQTEWPWLLAPTKPLFRVLLLAMPALPCLGGYLLWRWVEDPFRRCMRAMVAAHPAPRPAVVEVSVMPAENAIPHVASTLVTAVPAGRPHQRADQRNGGDSLSPMSQQPRPDST